MEDRNKKVIIFDGYVCEKNQYCQDLAHGDCKIPFPIGRGFVEVQIVKKCNMPNTYNS